MTVSETVEESELSVEPELLAGLESIVTTAGHREDRFDVEAPFTGDTIGRLPACGPEDVEAAFDRADDAQLAWADRSVEARAEVLKRYHDLVIDHHDDLLDVIQVESGKARRHAYE